MDVNRAREPAIAIGIIAIAGCVCAALVFAPSPVLRLGASVLLVLFLPGWPLLQALVPQQEPKLATLVFAVGLSLIVTIFAGLGLHFIGAMSRTGWAMALLAATLSACLGAHVRRQSPLVGTPGSVAPSLRPAQAAMLIGAALFTVSAVLLARAEAIERREFVYTEFWMVPDGDGLLALGIRNEEAAPSRYDVEVEVNGASPGNGAASISASVKAGPRILWRRSARSSGTALCTAPKRGSSRTGINVVFIAAFGCRLRGRTE